jgi:hypothetical protein
MRRVAVTCRCDGTRKTIPGWNYSWVVGVWWGVVGVWWGTSSWTAPVDVCRLALTTTWWR